MKTDPAGPGGGSDADLRPCARTAPERVRLLEGSAWASEFTARETAILADYLGAVDADPRAVIVEEGDKRDFLCLIVEGSVAVVKRGRGRKMKTLATAGPGKTFGEMSLVDHEPRSASVVALERTVLLVLHSGHFHRLAEEVPRLAFKLLLKLARQTSQRLRQASGALAELAGD